MAENINRNFHNIIGPNGMCSCGVEADGTVVTCAGLLRQETAFSCRDLFGDQSDDAEIVAAIAGIVREADEAFTASGGTSRHWVREQFLPILNKHGYRILSPLESATPVPARVQSEDVSPAIGSADQISPLATREGQGE